MPPGKHLARQGLPLHPAQPDEGAAARPDVLEKPPPQEPFPESRSSDCRILIVSHKPIMITAAAPLPGHPSDLHQQPHGHELLLPYRSECKGMAIFHYVSDVR